MSKWRFLVAIFFLVFPLLSCAEKKTLEMDDYGSFPEFSLINQNKEMVNQGDLKGKVILSNFIFTNCLEFCPILTPIMIQQQKLLPADVFGDSVIFLSFTVDPNNDTPEMLKIYSEKFDANLPGWHFLTGTDIEIKETVTYGFKLAFGQTPQSAKHIHEDGYLHIHEYDVFHTNRIVLSDKNGRIRSYYDATTDWDTNEIHEDILHLLKK